MYKEASCIDRRSLELPPARGKRPRGAVNPIAGTQKYAEDAERFLLIRKRRSSRFVAHQIRYLSKQSYLAHAPGPTRPVEAQTAVDLPAVARPSAETRPSIDPSIRATVERMVAQTAKPDETPSAAAATWISRSEGDASDAASIGRLGIDLVSTIVNCSGRRGAAAARVPRGVWRAQVVVMLGEEA